MSKTARRPCPFCAEAGVYDDHHGWVQRGDKVGVRDMSSRAARGRDRSAQRGPRRRIAQNVRRALANGNYEDIPTGREIAITRIQYRRMVGGH